MNWHSFAWGFGAGALTAVVVVIGAALRSVQGMFSKGD